jgi:hypothetical protein
MRLAAPLLALSLLAILPVSARAQFTTELAVQLTLPVRPALVLVQPGVQVVPDYDEEVFYASGGYWLRRGPTWFRAPRPSVAFALVPSARVPIVLAKLPPPGHYRRWKHVPPGQAKVHGRGHGHDKR